MTDKCKLIVSVIILLCCHHSLAADDEFNVEPSTVLKTLDKGHPRLMLKDKKPQLCQGNYHSQEEAKAQLARFAKSYSNLAEWKERGKVVREGILRGMELFPLPKKCPLNPIIHSRRKYDGYSVQNVAFESLPGVFVTGS
ncbi:MAG: hypothetical protein ACYS91_13630, partial [Planctomycetota bacterium]